MGVDVDEEEEVAVVAGGSSFSAVVTNFSSLEIDTFGLVG